MTRKDVTKYAPIAGAGTAAVVFGLDASSLLDYSLWEIALSFPLGAAIYLFVEFLCEKASPVSNEDGAS